MTDIREDSPDDKALRARFKHHLKSFDDPESVAAIKKILTVGAAYAALFAPLDHVNFSPTNLTYIGPCDQELRQFVENANPAFKFIQEFKAGAFDWILSDRPWKLTATILEHRAHSDKTRFSDLASLFDETNKERLLGHIKEPKLFVANATGVLVGQASTTDIKDLDVIFDAVAIHKLWPTETGALIDALAARFGELASCLENDPSIRAYADALSDAGADNSNWPDWLQQPQNPGGGSSCYVIPAGTVSCSRLTPSGPRLGRW